MVSGDDTRSSRAPGASNAATTPSSSSTTFRVYTPDDERIRRLHLPIPRKLALRLGPRLLGTREAGQAAKIRDVARELGGDTQTDAAAAHFRKAHRVARSAGSVRHAELATANALLGPALVAVELDRVPGEVQVAVEVSGTGREPTAKARAMLKELGLDSARIAASGERATPVLIERHTGPTDIRDNTLDV